MALDTKSYREVTEQATRRLITDKMSYAAQNGTAAHIIANVHKLCDEVDGLRAENERLHKIANLAESYRILIDEWSNDGNDSALWDRLSLAECELDAALAALARPEGGAR